MKYLVTLSILLAGLSVYGQNSCNSDYKLFKFTAGAQPVKIHSLGAFPQFDFLMHRKTTAEFVSAIRSDSNKEKYKRDFEELNTIFKAIGFSQGVSDPAFTETSLSFVVVPSGTVGNMGSNSENYKYAALLPATAKGFGAWKVTSPTGCYFYIFSFCGNAFYPDNSVKASDFKNTGTSGSAKKGAGNANADANAASGNGASSGTVATGSGHKKGHKKGTAAVAGAGAGAVAASTVGGGNGSGANSQANKGAGINNGAQVTINLNLQNSQAILDNALVKVTTITDINLSYYQRKAPGSDGGKISGSDLESILLKTDTVVSYEAASATTGESFKLAPSPVVEKVYSDTTINVPVTLSYVTGSAKTPEGKTVHKVIEIIVSKKTFDKYKKTHNITIQ